MRCLWHSHGKNPVRLYPKLQSQPIGLRKIFIDYLFFEADQSDCTKSVSLFNRFAERSLPDFSRLSFPTRGLGWLVKQLNQRNPSGYWQVTKGDLSQIITLLHDSFLFRSSFFKFSSVWFRAVISDRFFYSEFASFCRAQLEFSFFLFLSKTP